MVALLVLPLPQKNFLLEYFIIKDQWEKQEQARRTSSGGTYHRYINKRMEETSRRQRRMEASSDGGQDPEGAVAL